MKLTRQAGGYLTSAVIYQEFTYMTESILNTFTVLLSVFLLSKKENELERPNRCFLFAHVASSDLCEDTLIVLSQGFTTTGSPSHGLGPN